MHSARSTAWFGNKFPQPSVDMSFLSGTLDPSITFTRAAGAATYFDSTGTMQTAVSNLITTSGDLTTQLTTSACTVTAAQAIAPDGTNAMARIAEAATTAVHYAYKLVTVVASTTYTYSVYAQMQQNRYVQMIYDDGSANGSYATFDLQSGVVSQAQTVRGTGTTAGTSITPVGGGTYRLSISGGIAAATSARCVIALCTSGTPGFAPSYAGNSSNGLLIWGTQVELGSVATAYIPTTAATNSAARFDNDPVTQVPLGLLVEEARTNGLRNSTMVGAVVGAPGTLPTNWTTQTIAGLVWSVVAFGTDSGIPYIDLRLSGTSSSGNVCNINPDSGTTITASNTQVWTTSMYLKLVAGSFANVTAINMIVQEQTSANQHAASNITPTGAALASQRYSVSATNNQAGTTYEQGWLKIITATAPVAVDFTIRVGAPQLELGAFPTSFIPTSSVAVTRAADSALVASVPWFNASVGTAVTDWMVTNRSTVAAGVSPVLCQFDDGSNNNALEQRLVGAATTVQTQDWVANVGYSASSGNSWAQNSVSKFASVFTATTGSACLNAGAIVTSTGGSWGGMPSGINRLTIGTGRVNPLSGYIRRLRYWSSALTNAQMQQITT